MLSKLLHMRRPSITATPSPIGDAPRITIPYPLYRKIMGWMAVTTAEISWRGLVDWDRKGCTVTEVFLPRQNSGVGHVNVPTGAQGGDVAKWLTECVKAGTYENKQGDCRYKWHMHKHPGLGWLALGESGQDTSNTERIGEEVKDIEWMLIGRAVKEGKFCTYLEVFKPYRLSIGPLRTFVDYKGHPFIISQPERVPGLDITTVDISAEMFTSIGSGEAYANVVPDGVGYSISIAEDDVYNSIPCRVWKKEGSVYTQLFVAAGPWVFQTGPILCNVEIPLPRINIKTTMEVNRKRTASIWGGLGLGEDTKEGVGENIEVGQDTEQDDLGVWRWIFKRLGRGSWTS